MSNIRIISDSPMTKLGKGEGMLIKSVSKALEPSWSKLYKSTFLEVNP